LQAPQDPIAAFIACLLMSGMHCSSIYACRLLSMLLYAWLSGCSWGEQLLVPMILGFVYPCFAPKMVHGHRNLATWHTYCCSAHCIVAYIGSKLGYEDLVTCNMSACKIDHARLFCCAPSSCRSCDHFSPHVYKR
jgi:hypothetical protein